MGWRPTALTDRNEVRNMRALSGRQDAGAGGCALRWLWVVSGAW